MPDFLFHAHSGLRYLVLLAGVVALVVLARGRFGARPWSGAARGSLAAFTGLLDLQALLGVLVAFARPWRAPYVGHVVMMLLALAAAHLLGVRARRAASDHARYGTALLAVLVPLVLIVGGILAIGRRLV